jgi:hypothetical protein
MNSILLVKCYKIFFNLYMKNVDKNILTISLKFLQCPGKGTYKKNRAGGGGGGLLKKNSMRRPYFCLVSISHLQRVFYAKNSTHTNL